MMNHFYRNHFRRYLLLVPLFAIVLFYQGTYTALVLKGIFEPSVDVPFAMDGHKVQSMSKRAKDAGLQTGDILVSVNGSRITGERDLMRALPKDDSSVPILLNVNRRGTATAQTVAIPGAGKTTSTTAGQIALTTFLNAIMLFCVLIGVYTAARLPRDPRALVFFGIMVAASQVISSVQWWDFPRPLQYFAYLYRMLASCMTAGWLMLFGLYFPKQFAWDLRRPWLKWILLLPFAIPLIIGVIASDSFFDSTRMNWFFDAIGIHSINFFVDFALLFFCGALVTKYFISKERDVKRRLRILLAGCAVALIPLTLYLVQQAYTNDPQFGQKQTPELVVVCLLFCLFPFTLSYVIVTERAADLKVVLRQGMRYALAKAGVRVALGAVFAGVLFWIDLLFIQHKNTQNAIGGNSTITLTIYIALVLIGVILVRRTRKRLTTWVDRKFFREAYNAEIVLEELSDSVRTIPDEEQMLQTVAKRVSETLHVPQCAFLLEEGESFKPVYCLGFQPGESGVIPRNSITVDAVKESKTPAPIYYERDDNWIHETPAAEQHALRSLHAQLLLPLSSRNKLLGLISLGPKLSEEPYSRSDLQLLRSVAAQTGLALENTRLTHTVATEIAQREKLNREIEIAREVQERLFPQRLPAVAGVDYFGACRPALGVGGDYYDFLKLPNGDLGVAIGDVSGKGIAAALLMASLQASLRGQAMMGQGDLAQLMTNVNQLVYDASPVNRYATFFYGQYQRATGLFRYVNAGHNPPFIVRKNSNAATHVIRLETGGPVVGLFPGAPYQEGSLTLEPGDLFVGFTDGISEAMNNEDEEWGEERLIPAAAACTDRAAAEIIPELMTQADAFVSGAPQHDDMTMIVMKLDGRGEAVASYH